MKDKVKQALLQLKGWYPHSGVVSRGGRCQVCGHYDKPLRMVQSKSFRDEYTHWGVEYKRLCVDCHQHWEDENRDHLIAWKLAEK